MADKPDKDTDKKSDKDQDPPAKSTADTAADTTRTRNRGKYFHNHGPGMVSRDVEVLKRYKHTFHNADGMPDPREVVDIAFPGSDEPFCTCCLISDKPGDGVFVPA